jgi:hypothetical protein
MEGDSAVAAQIKKESEEMLVKNDAAFKKILDKLSTIDGISTGDAVELGRLIEKYGDCRAQAAIGPLVGGLVNTIMRKPEPPKDPWELGGRR